MDLTPKIKTKRIVAVITCMKQGYSGGARQNLEETLTQLETQEVLRLFFCFITACGLQPSVWKDHQTIRLFPSMCLHILFSRVIKFCCSTKTKACPVTMFDVLLVFNKQMTSWPQNWMCTTTEQEISQLSTSTSNLNFISKPLMQGCWRK
jgi:hypothetical protein